jgi:hypothetical protein
MRFVKLTALKKTGLFDVKYSVIAISPRMTGRLPTSPPLSASQRARKTAPRLSPVAAA